MIKDKLAVLRLMVVITSILLLTTSGESSRRILDGDSFTTIIANEGAIIDLKCTDTIFTEEHYIIWYRRTTEEDETEIYRNGSLLTTDLGKESSAYSLTNATEFEMTISITRGLYIGQWLHGNGYRCKAIKTTGDLLFDSKGYSFINVEYPQPRKYPLCVGSNYQSDSIGQDVTLSCYSEPGYPKITLEWWKDNFMLKSTTIEFQNSIRFAVTYLNHTFNLQQQDLEATYQCRVKWFNEVKGCIVHPTSSQPSTLIPTTEYNKTFFLTTEGKKTSQETMTSLKTICYITS